MNMRSTEARVGAFVVVCAAVLAVTVYFVSKAEFSGKQTPYRMYLHYAGGLEPGTAVLFGGISVGKVTSVRPDQADPTRIEISLGVKQGTPVNAKSLSKVGSITLLGSPVVSITTGSNDAARLPPGAVIPSQETISVDEMQHKIVALSDSAQTTLASVNTDVNKITADAHQVLANLNTLTGKANQERMAAILSKTDRTVTQLSSKAGPTLDNVNQTVTNANETITNANQTISSLRQPVQADLAELQRTLVTVHAVATNLQSMLTVNSENISYSLENLRAITDNLNDFTQTIKEEPWSLVRIKQPEDRKVPDGKHK
jgi:phospholipid/cholesterol/gamma-HCH transport system substrate-binding protein